MATLQDQAEDIKEPKPEVGGPDPFSVEELEAEFLRLSGKASGEAAGHPTRPIFGKPGQIYPPGFMELPIHPEKLSWEQAQEMFVRNVARSRESFRTIWSDVGVKGTLSYQMGKLATSSKLARTTPGLKGMKYTRFAAANAIGDVLGEIALQSAEIKLGQREDYSGMEIGISAGTSFGASFAAPVLTRFAARIGKIAPRDIKELMFSRLRRQLRLIWPKPIADPAVPNSMSAEMRLGKRLLLRGLGILKGAENLRLRRIAKELGEEIGVRSEDIFLPSAQRNMNMLKKASDEGQMISLQPLMDDAAEFATERLLPAPPFKRAANEVINTLAQLEEKYAAQGMMVSPVEYNRIAQDLEDRAMQTIMRMQAPKAQALAAPTALESEANRLWYKIHKSARNLLKLHMDAFSDGAWTANRMLTAKTLSNAEQVVSMMGDRKVVDFVANAASNEQMMRMLNEFDEINGTTFAKEVYDLFLNRRLSGGITAQTEPITGLARTVAPMLVIMTQVSKILGVSTSSVSAMMGGIASTTQREARIMGEAFKKTAEEELTILERQLEPPTP